MRRSLCLSASTPPPARTYSLSLLPLALPCCLADSSSCVRSTWPQFLLACCVFWLIIQSGKVPHTLAGSARGSRSGSGAAAPFWKDDVCCAFNLEQQDICLAKRSRRLPAPLPQTRNRFTGANLARNEPGSASGSRLVAGEEERAGGVLYAPQPAAFGVHKFVFNLKTFHSSLAFCSLIYGAKRFLFKYVSNKKKASQQRVKLQHGVPPCNAGCWLDCVAHPRYIPLPPANASYLPSSQTTCKLMKTDFYSQPEQLYRARTASTQKIRVLVGCLIYQKSSLCTHRHMWFTMFANFNWRALILSRVRISRNKILTNRI